MSYVTRVNRGASSERTGRVLQQTAELLQATDAVLQSHRKQPKQIIQLNETDIYGADESTCHPADVLMVPLASSTPQRASPTPRADLTAASETKSEREERSRPVFDKERKSADTAAVDGSFSVNVQFPAVASEAKLRNEAWMRASSASSSSSTSRNDKTFSPERELMKREAAAQAILSQWRRVHLLDETGASSYYYYHRETRQSCWSLPPEVAPYASMLKTVEKRRGGASSKPVVAASASLAAGTATRGSRQLVHPPSTEELFQYQPEQHDQYQYQHHQQEEEEDGPEERVLTDSLLALQQQGDSTLIAAAPPSAAVPLLASAPVPLTATRRHILPPALPSVPPSAIKRAPEDDDEYERKASVAADNNGSRMGAAAFLLASPSSASSYAAASEMPFTQRRLHRPDDKVEVLPAAAGGTTIAGTPTLTAGTTTATVSSAQQLASPSLLSSSTSTSGLVPCTHCGRNFFPDRVAKHSAACLESLSSLQRRKEMFGSFDSHHHRLKGQPLLEMMEETMHSSSLIGRAHHQHSNTPQAGAARALSQRRGSKQMQGVTPTASANTSVLVSATDAPRRVNNRPSLSRSLAPVAAPLAPLPRAAEHEAAATSAVSSHNNSLSGVARRLDYLSSSSSSGSESPIETAESLPVANASAIVAKDKEDEVEAVALVTTRSRGGSTIAADSEDDEQGQVSDTDSDSIEESDVEDTEARQEPPAAVVLADLDRAKRIAESAPVTCASCGLCFSGAAALCRHLVDCDAWAGDSKPQGTAQQGAGSGRDDDKAEAEDEAQLVPVPGTSTSLVSLHGSSEMLPLTTPIIAEAEEQFAAVQASPVEAPASARQTQPSTPQRPSAQAAVSNPSASARSTPSKPGQQVAASAAVVASVKRTPQPSRIPVPVRLLSSGLPTASPVQHSSSNAASDVKAATDAHADTSARTTTSVTMAPVKLEFSPPRSPAKQRAVAAMADASTEEGPAGHLRLLKKHAHDKQQHLQRPANPEAAVINPSACLPCPFCDQLQPREKLWLHLGDCGLDGFSAFAAEPTTSKVDINATAATVAHRNVYGDAVADVTAGSFSFVSPGVGSSSSSVSGDVTAVAASSRTMLSSSLRTAPLSRAKVLNGSSITTPATARAVAKVNSSNTSGSVRKTLSWTNRSSSARNDTTSSSSGRVSLATLRSATRRAMATARQLEEEEQRAVLGEQASENENGNDDEYKELLASTRRLIADFDREQEQEVEQEEPRLAASPESRPVSLPAAPAKASPKPTAKAVSHKRVGPTSKAGASKPASKKAQVPRVAAAASMAITPAKSKAVASPAPRAKPAATPVTSAKAGKQAPSAVAPSAATPTAEHLLSTARVEDAKAAAPSNDIDVSAVDHVPDEEEEHEQERPVDLLAKLRSVLHSVKVKYEEGSGALAGREVDFASSSFLSKSDGALSRSHQGLFDGEEQPSLVDLSGRSFLDHSRYEVDPKLEAPDITIEAIRMAAARVLLA